MGPWHLGILLAALIIYDLVPANQGVSTSYSLHYLETHEVFFRVAGH